jgi:hypothetical protein
MDKQEWTRSLVTHWEMHCRKCQRCRAWIRNARKAKGILMKELALILDDETALLIDPDGETVWDAYDDDDFNYTANTTEQEVIDYLIRKEIIAGAEDVSEITDERNNDDDDDNDDDNDDDDDDDDDEDDDE